MKAIFNHKYFKFGIVTFLYILFIIWLRNYWFLLALPIIYDLYVSKKVNWTFWKKREGKNNILIEWLDALIFAVVAVTLINIYFFQNYKIPTPSMESTMMVGDHLYVSKASYGPRAPITPLAFPFAQNRILNTESYLKWIQLDYKRLAGFGKVKRNDIVVFNFPAGDTVALENTAASFYSIVRGEAMSMMLRDRNMNQKEKSWDQYLNLANKRIREVAHIVVRPIDRRDNYIKRCVAVPGDTLRIVHSKVYINGEPQYPYKGIQHEYIVQTNGRPLNPRELEDYNIPIEQLNARYNPNYHLTISDKNAERLKQEIKSVIKVQLNERQGSYFQLFPHSDKYQWNEDNFGPVWMPEKGVTIDLNLDNLPFYTRVIRDYEKNKLELRDSTIFINDKAVNSYTFKMDYYWMMGDNRHSSSDSRYWGFVPENHIIGKPKFVWLSIDKDKKGLKKIRWKRLFSPVDASV
jgi:signal peptidase I